MLEVILQLYVLLPSATHLKVEQRCNIYNLTHYSYSRYKAVLSIAIIGSHFLVLIANCTITWLQYWNHSLTCYILWNSCTTLLTLLLLSSEWVSVQWTYNIVWKCNTITINNNSEQQNTVWSSVFTYAGLHVMCNNSSSITTNNSNWQLNHTVWPCVFTSVGTHTYVLVRNGQHRQHTGVVCNCQNQ